MTNIQLAVKTKKFSQIICKEPDTVLLDDNQFFADAFKFRFQHKKITHFSNPEHFIEQCDNYPKSTMICIDNDFGSVCTASGMQIAERLHKLGFTRLYLVSGTYFSEEEIPDYLIFIEKINLEFFSVM